MTPSPLPQRIGPAAFSELGRQVAVRAPRTLDWVFQQAGGVWEPGSRRWLIERRRLGPVIRRLRAATDLLFRRAGICLDVPDEDHGNPAGPAADLSPRKEGT